MPDSAEIDILILAGGLGTRVSHLLGDTPKPMAIVRGKPFLEWILLLMKENGFRRITISLGYSCEKIRSYFAGGKKWGLEISYVIEKNPLGTGGAIRQSLTKIYSNSFMVLNGDSMAFLDYKKFIKFHFQKKAKISLCAVEMDDVRRYGMIEFDGQDKIVSFKEKSSVPSKGWINAGIYMMRKDIFERLSFTGNFSLEYDVLPVYLKKDMYVFRSEGRFCDIGTPASLNSAQNFIYHFEKEREKKNDY